MLKSLDACFAKQCAYVRYMDDWLILFKSRPTLRAAVKGMHEVVERLKMRLAVAKTYIGRVAHGVDFLGYRFNARGLVGLAQKTIDNHQQKLARLYEQHATPSRLRQYVFHWRRWCSAGLSTAIYW